MEKVYPEFQVKGIELVDWLAKIKNGQELRVLNTGSIVGLHDQESGEIYMLEVKPTDKD